jgi:hypothetical protein
MLMRRRCLRTQGGRKISASPRARTLGDLAVYCQRAKAQPPPVAAGER